MSNIEKKSALYTVG